jgi:hypothetical protein
MAPSTHRRILSRLAHTSWREFCFRGTQELQNRWDGLLYRLGRLKSADANSQSSARLPAALRFFFSAVDLPMLVEILQQRFPTAADDIVAQAERICAHQFDLLGYKNLDLGPNIDWHLDAVHGKRAPRTLWYKVPYLDFGVCGDVKITWELNRHQHFPVLGKAYQLAGEEKYAREFVAQFHDWQKQNLYPIGVNWASSLEVAFRSLSWIWARELFGMSPSLSQEFHEELLAALERNGRFIERNLSYYFSPNTHLLGEGVALFFIGVLCPEFRSSRRWQEKGWQIVLAAARTQVRKDGGYFEQSTYYHVYALDFFLHARILAARNHIAIPTEFDRTIVAMLDYLTALGTAGAPPRFGDDDGGRLFDARRNCAEHLLDPLSTGAVLYSRPDYKAAGGSLREETLWLLGPGCAGDFDRLPRVQPPSHSRAFADSGTYILGSAGLKLALDAGPLGSARGGHGHADALSICVTADGSDWLADPGTFTYTGSLAGRNQFRGTRAHNTLVVDGLDQADAIEPFAWGRFPEVTIERWVPGETFDLLETAHDGYARLASPVHHRRLVFFAKDRFWLILDRAEGDGDHQLEIFWHCLPKSARVDDARRALAIGDHGGFALLPEHSPAWSVELADADWSPNYGAKELRLALRCHTKTSLPAEFATLIVPRVAGRDALGTFARKPSASSPLRIFEYIVSGERHLWVFADHAGSWRFEGFSSDAQVAYFALSSDSRIQNAVLCEGSFLAVRNETFLEAHHRCEKIEYRLNNDREEVFPAGAARVCRPFKAIGGELAQAAEVPGVSKRP